MPSIAAMENQLADQRMIEREVVRQIVNGVKATRAHNQVHKAACDRIKELEAAIEKARKRHGK